MNYMNEIVEVILSSIFIGLSMAFSWKGFGKITDNADAFIKKKYGEYTSCKICAVLFVVIMILIFASIITNIIV